MIASDHLGATAEGDGRIGGGEVVKSVSVAAELPVCDRLGVLDLRLVNTSPVVSEGAVVLAR